jgi:hypothetical protein
MSRRDIKLTVNRMINNIYPNISIILRGKSDRVDCLAPGRRDAPQERA